MENLVQMNIDRVPQGPALDESMPAYIKLRKNINKALLPIAISYFAHFGIQTDNAKALSLFSEVDAEMISSNMKEVADKKCPSCNSKTLDLCEQGKELFVLYYSTLITSSLTYVLEETEMTKRALANDDFELIRMPDSIGGNVDMLIGMLEYSYGDFNKPQAHLQHLRDNNVVDAVLRSDFSDHVAPMAKGMINSLELLKRALFTNTVMSHCYQARTTHSDDIKGVYDIYRKLSPIISEDDLNRTLKTVSDLGVKIPDSISSYENLKAYWSTDYNTCFSMDMG